MITGFGAFSKPSCLLFQVEDFYHPKLGCRYVHHLVASSATVLRAAPQVLNSTGSAGRAAIDHILSLIPSAHPGLFCGFRLRTYRSQRLLQLTIIFFEGKRHHATATKELCCAHGHPRRFSWQAGAMRCLDGSKNEHGSVCFSNGLWRY